MIYDLISRRYVALTVISIHSHPLKDEEKEILWKVHERILRYDSKQYQKVLCLSGMLGRDVSLQIDQLVSSAK